MGIGTPRRTVAVITAVAATSLGVACGTDGGSSDDASGPVVGAPTATEERMGGVGDAVEVVTGAPGDASAAACAADRTTLETAAELYLVLEGTPADDQQDLLEAELLTERSPLFVLTPDGRVEPAADSPC